MPHRWSILRPLLYWLGCLAILTTILAACGGSATPTSNATGHTAAFNVQNQTASNTQGGQSTNTQKDSSTLSTPQYLIRTLKVDLSVKDTRAAASGLQTWIANDDPLSSSAGTSYQQIGDNLYIVSLTFSVQAQRYSDVYNYLRDYTTRNAGHLNGFDETVQNVTGTYVDTDSRIQNLKAEQARLQDLLSHAQALNDIITIEQRLTDVEGQIETLETQLNTLKSQVTYYTVTITLQPIRSFSPSQPVPNTGWSLGQTIHDAFFASVTVGEGLLNFLIWLLAFAIYIVPAVILLWLLWKWYQRSQESIYAPSSVATARPKSTPLPEPETHQTEVK
ncbi:DUF4349 domain-containing protein [Tengunoibacter tsumagoiensis]|uniref:DUF4349 domain-containing protein n=1 Tax=Tengunoibacter tsumagoiensis TaxID=2014871 RepID=A0A402A0V4_9CHLR|nr:DUF4349 domain-containing protein [Tengunoibacter tsumagoiensis]GCE12744.1 hypothetical protein KTT_26030 [Tengunoibacter tsumagoiensis]